MKIFLPVLIIIMLLSTAAVGIMKPQLNKSLRIDTNIVQKEEKPETLEWSNWRSTVLNEILKTAKAPAGQPIGTINYFEFKVDNKKNITNIKIYSEPQEYSKEAQKTLSEVIRNLDGKEILEFPKNSMRKSVEFKAAAKTSDKIKLSTPKDFDDIEVIKR